MKTIYTTFMLIAILLASFLLLYFWNIPSPSINIVETFTLEIK